MKTRWVNEKNRLDPSSYCKDAKRKVKNSVSKKEVFNKAWRVLTAICHCFLSRRSYTDWQLLNQWLRESNINVHGDSQGPSYKEES